jgi:hypothetical protein
VILFLDFVFSVLAGERWAVVTTLVYFVILITGIVLSLTIHRRRRAVRIATIILTTPIWLSIAMFVFIWFTFLKEPPTLRELRSDFSSKRADLETILAMADDDKEFSRIAPDFLDRATDIPGDFGRYEAHDPRAKLSNARWDAYRRIYSRNDIKLGFQRNSAGDTFIMLGSVGFLDRGHITGYLHCVAASPPDLYRFGACIHQDEKAVHSVGDYSGDEKYSFEKLDDGWFAYDEGPDAE